MPLVRTTHRPFHAPVRVRHPDGSTEDFRARYVSLPITDFNGFDLATEEGARAFLDAALQDASEIVDAHGNPEAFDDSLKAWMINDASIRQGLIAAYIEAHRGN